MKSPPSTRSPGSRWHDRRPSPRILHPDGHVTGREATPRPPGRACSGSPAALAPGAQSRVRLRRQFHLLSAWAARLSRHGVRREVHAVVGATNPASSRLQNASASGRSCRRFRTRCSPDTAGRAASARSLRGHRRDSTQTLPSTPEKCSIRPARGGGCTARADRSRPRCGRASGAGGVLPTA